MLQSTTGEEVQAALQAQSWLAAGLSSITLQGLTGHRPSWLKGTSGPPDPGPQRLFLQSYLFREVTSVPPSPIIHDWS